MKNNEKAMLTMVLIFATTFVLRFFLTGPQTGIILTFFSVFSVFIFAILHGAELYGLRNILIFVAITFVVSWIYETVSILTGFPFGNYYYTEFFGPKIWMVPFIIMPTYFAVGYLAWVLSHILIDKFHFKMEKSTLFITPLIAAFLMVMWDLAMDPILATVANAWIWEEGGAYFGVTFQNYAGWFLCVFTIYVLFAWLLYAQSRKNPDEQPRMIKYKYMWYYPIFLYAAHGFGFILNPLAVNSTEQITTLDGHTWWTGDIYASTALVCIFTMFFVTVLSIIKIQRSKEIG